jgi:hypothetical protein
VRRGWVLVGLLTAVVLLTAGCGRPSGVDANLTDDWPPFPTPTLPVPAENACYRVFSTDPAVFAKPRDPVRCADVHEVETIHVGSFAGADGNASYPPVAGGPAMRTAYGDCAGHARDFLGDDWRTGRLRLYITTPNQQYWDDGARWYRCDLVAYRDEALDEADTPIRSLRGALTGDRAYHRGCANLVVSDSLLDTIIGVDCSTAHNGEFGGIFEPPDGPVPTDHNKIAAMYSAGCAGVIARFAGVPDDGNLRHRLGYAALPAGSAAWLTGNRGALCYLWFPDQTVTGSVQGAGPARLPTR